jgi:hypothetical protein
MSVEKKLATLANNKSIIDAYTNSSMSLLRKELAIKSKEMYQVSTDREITVTNANWGSQGHFRVRETFSGAFCMEIRLPAGTYQLPNNWISQAVVRIRQKIGGEQEIVKHNWANVIQTYRESESEATRDKLSNLMGNAVTNPTSEVVAYLFLNIQTSSINPHVKQLYPNYQLNVSTEFDIDFAEKTSIAIAGTLPNISSCKILYEYAAPLRQRDLRPKFDNPSNPAAKVGEEIIFHELVSYEYPVAAGGGISKQVRLRSYPLSEIDELVMIFVNDTDIATNKNKLLSQKLRNIKLTMSDREIIDAQRDFQDIKALFRNELPNTYKVGGVEKNFYVLDLTPMNYVHQEKKMTYIQGVILSEEDLLLEFDIPADVAGQLYIYGVKKVFHRFKNGNMQRFY